MAKRLKKKRGPKPNFLDISYPNPNCKHHAKKDLDNVVFNGTYRTRSTGKTRLFLCRTCGKAFSGQTRTGFFCLRTSKKKVLMGLKLLAEGLGLRGTSRVLEIKLDTIRGWLSTAALHCDQVSNMLLRGILSFPRSKWMNSASFLKKHQNPIGSITPTNLPSHKWGAAEA